MSATRELSAAFFAAVSGDPPPITVAEVVALSDDEYETEFIGIGFWSFKTVYIRAASFHPGVQSRFCAEILADFNA